MIFLLCLMLLIVIFSILLLKKAKQAQATLKKTIDDRDAVLQSKEEELRRLQIDFETSSTENISLIARLHEYNDKYSGLIDKDNALKETEQKLSLLTVELDTLALRQANATEHHTELLKEIDARTIERNQLRTEFDELKQNERDLKDKVNEYSMKAQRLSEIEEELETKNKSIKIIDTNLNDLNNKYQQALQFHAKLEEEIRLFKDSLEITEFGLYEPQYNFDLPDQYKLELENNYAAQKGMIASDRAVVCHTEWSVGGSVTEGKKMTKQYTKLMLFAFNGECDGFIAKVKWNNATKTKERILKAFETINKLGGVHNIEVTEGFLNLKLRELSLTYEYEQKKYEEKEEQRRIREQMREEEKAQKEYERAQKDAEDEEKRYQKALDKAKKDLGLASKEDFDALNAKIHELEKNLQDAHERKERAISLAQMTKVGHIYVISNIGSFGEDIYKIGMTRRLDPLDRVKELGDASVPFQFDVHAIIYSENAPQLEYELHKKFSERRLNRINSRKEFFKVSLAEIETFIHECTNADIQFTKLAEAKEYRETLKTIAQLNEILNPTAKEEIFPASLV